MRESFDEILSECIRRLERGGELEAVLSEYPEQADELRPHLEVWASLSSVDEAQATQQGEMRGRRQLLNALAKAGQEESSSLISNLAAKGGSSMRYVAMLAVGAALALGITFLTGNLEFGSGSSTAEADPISECLPLLDLNEDGVTDLDDVLFAKEKLESGEWDIFDVVQRLQAFVDCIEAQVIFPTPTPPPVP